MWDRKELKARGKAAFRANYWKSVLAAGACSSSPVELILKDWRKVWPEVDMEASALQMHGKFVLLDAETGYRSQRRRGSWLIEIG